MNFRDGNRLEFKQAKHSSFSQSKLFVKLVKRFSLFVIKLYGLKASRYIDGMMLIEFLKCENINGFTSPVSVTEILIELW